MQNWLFALLACTHFLGVLATTLHEVDLGRVSFDKSFKWIVHTDGNHDHHMGWHQINGLPKCVSDYGGRLANIESAEELQAISDAFRALRATIEPICDILGTDDFCKTGLPLQKSGADWWYSVTFNTITGGRRIADFWPEYQDHLLVSFYQRQGIERKVKTAQEGGGSAWGFLLPYGKPGGNGTAVMAQESALTGFDWPGPVSDRPQFLHIKAEKSRLAKHAKLFEAILCEVPDNTTYPFSDRASGVKSRIRMLTYKDRKIAAEGRFAAVVIGQSEAAESFHSCISRCLLFDHCFAVETEPVGDGTFRCHYILPGLMSALRTDQETASGWAISLFTDAAS